MPALALHWAVDLASAGHEAEEPEQFSATSHCPTDALHSNEDGWNPSVGQLLFVPSQDSVTSQMPALALHWAVDLALAGQVAEEPVQLSAISHWPTDALHTVESGRN